MEHILLNFAGWLQEVADAPITAESAQAAADNALFTTNNVWMLVCTALVFIMHLGFASVESGFTQSKNTVNILYKNTITPLIGVLTYAFIGFNLMYPGTFSLWGWFPEISAATIGLKSVAHVAEDAAKGIYNPGYTYWTDFLFQAMFAATTTTIVSGAVAERIKITSYMTFTLIFVGLVYPILGSWKWGGGALEALGFYDFAGSTLVHSVGGWGALAGIMVLGPRVGKYVDGKVIDKPGSSVPLATLGVFLLIFGWFGFNGGSVLSADPDLISLVLVTTTLGAAGGGIAGMITGLIVFKRLDLGMVLNGILAGLVGITASADIITPSEAIFIGVIAGILVVLSAISLDKLRLDDCVGAVSVHLVCGIWGTLAAGIFGEGKTLLPQIYGVLAYGVATFGISLAIFMTLKATTGIRVSEEHEVEGLDSHEHGIRGYTIVHDS